MNIINNDIAIPFLSKIINTQFNITKTTLCDNMIQPSSPKILSENNEISSDSYDVIQSETEIPRGTSPTKIISNIHCSNCGKYGHAFKRCKEPITSIGIINIYLNDVRLEHAFENKYILSNIMLKYKNNYCIKNIAISKFNEKNKINTNADIITEYMKIVKENIKVLMIRRKNTVGYIEFVKGRYDEHNNNEILLLLNQMTNTEIKYLLNNSFDNIWYEMWNGKYSNLPLNENNFYIADANTILLNGTIDTELEKNFNNLSTKDKFIYVKIHLKDYLISKKKFEFVKFTKIIEFLFPSIVVKYEEAEWGFPKGRRNIYEKNMDCALREFEEETGIQGTTIKMMDRIYPLNELLTGTNNINYKHIYYLSFSQQLELHLTQQSQIMEIGAIGWFNYNEAIKLIRPYHINRIKILDDIILFIAYNLKYLMRN